MAEKASSNLHEPNDVFYADSPSMIRYNETRFAYDQGSMMVDADSRAIVQDNIPAIPSAVPQTLAQRLGLGVPARVDTWDVVGMSTYKLFVDFQPRNAAPFTETRYSMQGTAVHLGEGIFITCAHLCTWLNGPSGLGYTSATHTAKIWLRGGSGCLVTSEKPGNSLADILVEVCSWPPYLLEKAVNEKMAVSGGLLDGRFMVPLLSDYCLLKAAPRRWLARVKADGRPHVLPFRGRPVPSPFSIVFVGVNGRDYEPGKYDPYVNTRDYLDGCRDKLLPNVVSISRSDGAEAKVITKNGVVMGAEEDEEPHYFRYPISCLCGSSGSGVYDESGRLIGIHTKSVTDSLKSAAVSTRSPSFRIFAELCIVPQMRKIGNGNARRIADEWMV